MSLVHTTSTFLTSSFSPSVQSVSALTQGWMSRAEFDRIRPGLLEATAETLYMVALTLLFAGILGLLLGILLYVTRDNGILHNKAVFIGLNFLVNFVRPIPFIILTAVLGSVTKAVVGTTLGIRAAIFVMTIAATFAVARIVEQNLITVSPGVIEAGRAMGAGPWRIIFTIVIPEALAPLILGYTFLFIGIVDMSAVAQAIGAGGLGQFALTEGYNQFNWPVTILATIVIIIIVQAAQFFGNWLAKKVLTHS